MGSQWHPRRHRAPDSPLGCNRSVADANTWRSQSRLLHMCFACVEIVVMQLAQEQLSCAKTCVQCARKGLHKAQRNMSSLDSVILLQRAAPEGMAGEHWKRAFWRCKGLRGRGNSPSGMQVNAPAYPAKTSSSILLSSI
eukprot:CAMPEP_0174386844 /NCGR_PEP_ID=MMETSP0811_2-20130205/127552_1 /TAXON_ID=73025 ORGANISM="Eutreptiella gymnastica-like, Strain CCMP1594" /NCGR_SAMPLE_ID=MMETSP0811_2 /ASSEMBLY_ACC=CAM_ASM_000667 /LENGTH=138 /DNA_ID=CAMNT_0015541661 /DNA_START=1087 /DNA_END=1504 /DNA_ORIENTATION=-